MAGEGSIMHAIISLRNNKRNRENALSKIKKFENDPHIPLEFPQKATQKQLEEIRNQLQTENKINRKKQLFWVLFWMLILVVVFIAINSFFTFNIKPYNF